MGDVMGDISSKRGKILGMDSDGHFQIIKGTTFHFLNFISIRLI
ncbi:MAG: hypothetical protein MZV64_47720 [Ignavibacteriales bacterium]|nr:hypothetical protein [Ignavibacteriales bacterium]